MKTDKIEGLILNSDLNKLQKNVWIGFLKRSAESQLKKDVDRELIEYVGRVKHVSEVVYSSDEVKIYTVGGKDEWDVKYPYRSIYFADGKWVASSGVSPTFEIAVLIFLQGKHLDQDSYFVDVAMKLLDIKIEE